jgi:maleylacetoacetate isomerase
VHLVRNEQVRRRSATSPGHAAGAVAEGSTTLMLTQSLAIIEYLDETHPQPPLLPADALGRARVRAIALDIACEIHPLNNLRVLRYLVDEMKVSEDDKNRWYATGSRPGSSGRAAACRPPGDRPLLPWRHADAGRRVLVPQIHNAQRIACRLDHVPTR